MYTVARLWCIYFCVPFFMMHVSLSDPVGLQTVTHDAAIVSCWLLQEAISVLLSTQKSAGLQDLFLQGAHL